MSKADEIGRAVGGALADDREIRKLEGQLADLIADREQERAKADQEQAERAAQLDAETDAAIAELDRREAAEPVGSLMHAVRESHERGLDHVAPDLVDGLTADALRELRRHPDIYHATLGAYGTAALGGHLK